MIYILVLNTIAFLNPVYFVQINFHFDSTNGNGNPFSRKRTLTFYAFSVPKYLFCYFSIAIVLFGAMWKV